MNKLLFSNTWKLEINTEKNAYGLEFVEEKNPQTHLFC